MKRGQKKKKKKAIPHSPKGDTPYRKKEREKERKREF